MTNANEGGRSIELQRQIRDGDVIRWKDELWRILAVDSDPDAHAWIVSVDDPDRDALAPAAELAVPPAGADGAGGE